MSHLPLLFVVCKRFSAVSLSRGIRTDAFSLLNRRGRNGPRSVSYERDIRNDFEDEEEVDEEMLHQEVDIMNIDRAYDLDRSERTRRKIQTQRIITAKQFFKPRPDPLTLTCNERQYIRFLHKKDPVQWDIHTLSESFPATPATIKKIINQKWKITPERAKVLDTKVQENWTLLEQGKLDADPKLLEHLKKFVNRREVLLEQLKNSDHYLPEVKNEPEWNCGEFKSILSKYEKRIEKLARKEKKQKMLNDGVSEGQDQEKAEESRDALQKRITREIARKKLENKDSFLYGNVTEFYSKHTTLEQMEEELLKKAMANKKLRMVEKTILDNILNGRSHGEAEMSYLKQNYVESDTPQERKENTEQSAEAEVKSLADIELDRIEMEVINSRRKGKKKEMSEGETLEPLPVTGSPNDRTAFSIQTRSDKTFNNVVQGGAEVRARQFDFQNKFSASEQRIREEQILGIEEPFVYPDDRTKFSTETGVAKALEGLQNQSMPETTPKAEVKITQKKPEISDPEKVQRAKEYFDKEVSHIKNTAFWNSNRTSRDKALAEEDKAVLYEESRVSSPEESRNCGFYLSETPYPERINIPENQRRPGATYKVNDCYYDDDGEFLYRVPGMTK